jgi:hypothetical protein
MARPPKPSGFNCYHCGSSQTSKAGFARGKQRFYCRACRRFFRDNPVLPEGGNQKGWRPKSLPSKSHLILELQAIAQRLGKTPTTGDINELSKQGRAYSLNIYYEVFDSFPEAIKKARLKPNYKQKFDKEKLIHELRVLRKKLKRPLLGKDVAAARKKGIVSSLYHFQRAFGSVPKAIEAAGVGRQKYSRAEMIKILREIDAKLDRPVLAADIDELYRSGEGPSSRAVEREFGGLAKARRAAGITNAFRKAKTSTRYWRKYTPEGLIEQLRSLGKSLGRKPTVATSTERVKKGCAPRPPRLPICSALCRKPTGKPVLNKSDRGLTPMVKSFRHSKNWRKKKGECRPIMKFFQPAKRVNARLREQSSDDWANLPI